MRRVLVITAIAILCVGVGALSFALTRTARTANNNKSVAHLPASSVLQVGGRVPTSFTLQRLGGGPTVKLSRLLDGHVGVINVFASWCQACASELAAFATVAGQLGHKVVFVGVDTNDPDTAKSLSLLRQAGAHYPVGLDTPDLGVASAYGIANLPTTLYIGKNGRLVAAVLGAQSASQLRAHLAALG